jgi:transketolase
VPVNNISDKQVICDVLMDMAARDRDILVLCGDSRGSASLTPFAEKLPGQFVETGIAEQNLVSVAAGLARCGKKPVAASPACFLSTRSFEQCKVDVAYSQTNVKLLGISGGVSYGALGMTHHSLQDIAAFAAVPGMRVYIPSDAHLTRKLFTALMRDGSAAYIRVGRNPVEELYPDGCPFTMDRAVLVNDGGDAAIIACGEMVQQAAGAAGLLRERGRHAAVLDMYCVKPLDREAVLGLARRVPLVLTVEEHSLFGGLGAMVSQIIGAECPRRVINLGLPDEALKAGKSSEIFAWYGLDAAGIAKTVEGLLRHG